jgi:hypothetical protein
MDHRKRTGSMPRKIYDPALSLVDAVPGTREDTSVTRRSEQF